MLRQGLQRLHLALQQQCPQQYERLLLSGANGGPSSFSSANVVMRGLHKQAMSLPLQPHVFEAVQQQGEGALAKLMRRLFSTGKPRGFENFGPRTGTQAKAAAAKADKAKPTNSGSGGNSNKDGGDGGNQLRMPLQWLAVGALALYFWASSSSVAGSSGPRHEISFQEFRSKLLAKGQVAKLEVVNGQTVRVYVRSIESDMDSLGSPGSVQPSYKYHFAVGSIDSFERKMDEAQKDLGLPPDAYVPVKYVHEVSLVSVMVDVLPTLLLLGGAFWLVNRQMKQMGGGMGGMGKAGGKAGGKGGFFNMVRANVGTLDKAAKDKTTFKDVAGCDEAKLEIMEFVDFLKKPDKYRELGAKIPKGALLVGPPGTGKTLLAKATAGEAGVPFLSISGSDFMEMFVGVGPARVRDLFAQARSQSPSIIFIDEIDAIGRARGRGGQMGGNDERENTLNQLLVEMDGFATTEGVIVLAGTNRPDVLDKALLRPGRFDRTISVDAPDIKGREQIFRVHLGKLKLVREVKFYSERLAALTPGMSGADIANVCNEGALVAARFEKEAVDMPDFEKAIDRVIGGLEKKNKVISPEERRTVAFHESGHAVVSWFLEYAEPLLKVSIVPRGANVLGFAQYLPNENMLMTKEQLLDRLCATLGGRAAEQVLLGKISTGAVNDLERVTQMAYSQVAVYGMNEKVGLLSYRMDREAFDKPYSNETAQLIDQEVREFTNSAYKRTIDLVTKHKDLITDMTNELLSKEVLNINDVERILGKRPFHSNEMRNIDRFRHGLGSEAESAQGEGNPPIDGKGDGGSDGRGDGGGTPLAPEHARVELPGMAPEPTGVGLAGVGSAEGSGPGKSGKRRPVAPGGVVAT
mmetsp:Transcript_7855/g.13510  ORF Transcript_7855/g.13510 Transcript_7855/m.13510 type:complete len:862 (-) Transcript_7855:907-3492(-)|eukprot:CAMPEP_0119101742 /NCGR_PEP_ID=MMETSP1180-20130426/708_1 /TAXON_ID=3052 ORGANISM="Chlamydomonas cf sp, Strain CCMP681" /NCGR_SAMPLE_ID=MMETSP1180 /ASSEMBLY_ACC=CAM_ASM_000741 /LENGTH=861 /DNA_ID=CAMNT_0007085909 /DNA_START=105 /DNA_END=2690 /DNA_ORIENTATION=+